jgi:hypothetical protein
VLLEYASGVEHTDFVGLVDAVGVEEVDGVELVLVGVDVGAEDVLVLGVEVQDTVVVEFGKVWGHSWGGFEGLEDLVAFAQIVSAFKALLGVKAQHLGQKQDGVERVLFNEMGAVLHSDSLVSTSEQCLEDIIYTLLQLIAE